VATLASTAFGAFGEGYIRLSYANSIENIGKALGASKGVGQARRAQKYIRPKRAARRARPGRMARRRLSRAHWRPGEGARVPTARPTGLCALGSAGVTLRTPNAPFAQRRGCEACHKYVGGRVITSNLVARKRRRTRPCWGKHSWGC
jgi:hypothetical protein